MKHTTLNRRDAMRVAAGATAAAAFGSTWFLPPVNAQPTGKLVRTFDVLDYGAAGDGTTLDTAAIQKAINEAAAAGGGSRVLIRGGHRYLVGTLELRGGIDFHLADDAELIVSVNQDDYTSPGVITAGGAHGLKISGTGKLNGRAKEFMERYDKEDEWWLFKKFRPKMFVLTACKGLEIHDITFGDAPEWGLHMIGCEGVLVENIKIRNLLDVPNCDGIDPDHCRDVEIRNCDIVCGDDAIVVKTTRQTADYGPSANIRVKDCILETQDSGVKIGTETTQDIHDVVFERCEIRSGSRGICIQLRDEGNVYKIDFREIKFVSRYFSAPWWGRGEAISLTAIPRTAETKLGTIHDVRIQNVAGRAENSVRVCGTAESPVRDVAFDNVAVTLDRWTSYPGGVFDNRPTKVYEEIESHGTPGFYIRNADNVLLKNCSVAWGKNLPDYFTNALEAKNASNLQITQLTGQAAHPDRNPAILID